MWSPGSPGVNDTIGKGRATQLRRFAGVAESAQLPAEFSRQALFAVALPPGNRLISVSRQAKHHGTIVRLYQLSGD
ncbi:hypothetical protein ASC80_05985 [Afipia sp. Root123D2]|nr:hypothetical protein ASC80_05985 [Afipia sp. Root123D2]